MHRKERQNMTRFLSKVRGLEDQHLMIMTDEEVEYLYTQTYEQHERIE